MGNPENTPSIDSYDWEHGGLTSAQIENMLTEEQNKAIDEAMEKADERGSNPVTYNVTATAALRVIRHIQEKIEGNEGILNRYTTAYRTNRFKNRLTELADQIRRDATNIEKTENINSLKDSIDKAENETLQNFRAYISYYMGYCMTYAVYPDGEDKENSEGKKVEKLPAMVDQYGWVKFLPGSEKIGNKDTTLNDLFFFLKHAETGYVREGTDKTIYRYVKDGQLYETTNEEIARKNGGDILKSGMDIDIKKYTYIIDYSKCSDEIKNEVRKKLGLLDDVVVTGASHTHFGISTNLLGSKYKKESIKDDKLRFEIKCDGISGNGTVTVKINGKDITQEEFGIGNFPVGAGLTIQEKGGYVIGSREKNTELFHEYGTLSEEDFDRDFEGDDFEQDMGNCYMLSYIDSFTNFGDYELLIRTNVKKNDMGGYDIRLPMRYPPHNKEKYYSITKEDMLGSQEGSAGNYLIPIKNAKLGIQCLVLALGERLTGKKVYDMKTIVGGSGDQVYGALLDSQDFKIIGYDLDSVGEKYFKKKLEEYALKFNKETDLMQVSVYWPGKREDIKDAKEHDGGSHQISMEGVYKKEGRLYARLSNPWEAGKCYYMPYNEFINKCYRFFYTSRDSDKVDADKNAKEITESKMEAGPAGGDVPSMNQWMIEHKPKWLKGEFGNMGHFVYKHYFKMPDGTYRTPESEEESKQIKKSGGQEYFEAKSFGETTIVKRNRPDPQNPALVFTSGSISLELSGDLFKVITNNTRSSGVQLFANFINYVKFVNKNKYTYKFVADESYGLQFSEPYISEPSGRPFGFSYSREQFGLNPIKDENKKNNIVNFLNSLGSKGRTPDNPQDSQLRSPTGHPGIIT